MTSAHPKPVISLIVAALALMVAEPASASSWTDPLRAGSTGEAQASSLPAAPGGVAAACVASNGSKITVTWNSVTHASSYAVYDSTTSATSGFGQVASGVAATSWTSGVLLSGNYWFEVSTAIGSNWTSGRSTASGESTVVKNSSCVQP